MKEKFFPDRAVLISNLVIYIEQLIVDALKQRGEARLALAGGSTPKALYAQLAKVDLPWNKVIVTLTDERVLPHSHADSNSRMLQESLIQLTGAQFIAWTNEAPNAPAVAAQVTAAIQLPFDLVLLGMGADGHTASLFPDAPSYRSAMDVQSCPACVVVDTQWMPYQRLSLNKSALDQSRMQILLWHGDDKKSVYDKARAGQLELPIAHFLTNSQMEVWSIT